MLDLHLKIRGAVEYAPNESTVSCDSANIEVSADDIGKLVNNTATNGASLMEWLDTVEGTAFLVEYLKLLPDDFLRTLLTEDHELYEAAKGALGYASDR
tara:strand:+ start:2576 stop:2872 length:297 start_codon:yes stop_codon:yes gene_type:complete